MAKVLNLRGPLILLAEDRWGRLGGMGAFGESVVFLGHFKDLPDPRQPGKVIYPLDEVLLLCLLAVLAGAETFVDIARFGEKKIDLLRRFRPFRDGTPAHDHLGDIFATLDAEAIPALLRGLGGGADRRAGRGDRHRRQDAAPLLPEERRQGADPHGSAFAARQRLVLGQVKVAEKSNEIVAIPELLDMLAIEGAIVTIDAMGCQRDIAQKIIDKKADYVLALKGNQGSLREDVELFAAEQKANGFKDTTISRDQTVDGDHGRIETRTTTVIHDVAWLQERHDWPGLKAVVMVESTREIKPPKDRAGDTLLHHLPGMARAPARARHPQPLGDRKQPPLGDGHDLPRRRMPYPNRSRATLRHIAHNLIRRAPGKDSLRLNARSPHGTMTSSQV